MIKAEDIKVEHWPKQHRSGMQVGIGPAGIHITHIPTGIGVSSINERSQYKNKQIALERLEFLLTFYDQA